MSCTVQAINKNNSVPLFTLSYDTKQKALESFNRITSSVFIYKSDTVIQQNTELQTVFIADGPEHLYKVQLTISK